MTQTGLTTYAVEVDGTKLSARSVKFSAALDECPSVQLEINSGADIECDAIVELDDDFIIQQCALKLRNQHSNFMGRLGSLVNRITEEDAQKFWGKKE
jgi:hypothetical protein